MTPETFCEQFATFAEAPNGVAKLRELILQLAVQGKLGTQDANDEPVSVLIADLKQQANQESPFALPPNWRWISLSAIATVVRGVSYQKHDASVIEKPGYVPLLRANNIGVRLNFDDLVFVPKECVSPEQFVKADDVVIAMSSGSKNLVGKAAQAESDFAGGFGAFCGVIRLTAPIDAKFFGMFFRSPYYRERIASEGKGIGINNVQKGSLLALPVPLPPLAEQRRIVGKVDQLLGLCDELAARQAARREARSALVGATLDRLVSARSAAEFPAHAHRLRDHFDRLFDTPTTLPQLRQAILQLAVQGQLVPQDPNDESANDSTPEAELQSLATIVRGSSPRPKSDPKYYGGSVPRLLIADITRDGKFVTPQIDSLTQEGATLSRPMSRGSLVISISGSYGIPAFLAVDACIHDGFIGLRNVSARIDLEYLFLVFQFRKPYFDSVVKDSGLKNLTTTHLKKMPVPMRTLSEQKRIVSKVTELLSLCDALEAKLTQAESASTQLLSAAVHHLLATTSIYS